MRCFSSSSCSSSPLFLIAEELVAGLSASLFLEMSLCPSLMLSPILSDWLRFKEKAE